MQGLADHLTLPHAVIRTTERKPEWVRYGECARRTNTLRHVTQQSDTHGSDAGSLEHSGEQSHGLRAHRSYRDQEHRLDIVRAENLGNARASLQDEPSWRRDRAIDADMPWCD